MSRNKDWYVLLMFIVVTVGLGKWHIYSQAHNKSDVFASFFRYSTTPLQSIVSSGTNETGSLFYGLFHAHSLTNQNRQLKEQIQLLQIQNARMQLIAKENEHLRNLCGFTPLEGQNWKLAEVILIYPDRNSMSAGIGSRQGVKVGAPVITSEGLVGQVTVVDLFSSVITLITSNEFNVGVRVQRNQAIGVCQGQGDQLLILNYLTSSSEIKEGDLVLTSGLGRTYPKGLVVGHLQRVWLDPIYNVQRASVKPAVNSEKLEEVFILL